MMKVKRYAAMLLVALFGMLIVSCGGEETDAIDVNVKSNANGVVERMGDGVWVYREGMGMYQPPQYAFWIDLKVKNLGYHKTVGVNFSNDEWKTVRTANAVYKESLAGGYEKWHVEVVLSMTENTPGYAGQGWPNRSFADTEYQIFATIEGQNYKDDRYNILTMGDWNVKYLGGSVASSGNDAFFEGAVKVKDLAFDKKVTVVYTTDGWATNGKASAKWKERNNWTFLLPLSYPSSQSLEFAVEYVANGKSYWDNNRDQNYTYQIGPKPVLRDSERTILSGIEMIVLEDTNMNTNVDVHMYLGEKELETVTTGNQLRAVVKTAEFTAEESLQLFVKVTDDKGFSFEKTYSPVFTIRNDVVSRGSFGEDVIQWPKHLEVKNGKMVIADSGEYVVGPGAFLVYDLVSKSFRQIKTDAAVMDAAFAENGSVVALTGDWGSRKISLYSAEGAKTGEFDVENLIDNPVEVEVSGNEIFVASYVTDFILVVDFEGNVLRNISVNAYSFNKMEVADGKIYLMSAYNAGVRVFSQDGTLLSTVLLETSPYFGHFDAFTVTTDGFIFVQEGSVHVVDREGNAVARWTGTWQEGLESADGILQSPVSSVAVDGDVIYVGVFGNHRIHTFELVK